MAAGLNGARRGQIVLITGASSGIGAAAARCYAEEGATVALVARRADRLQEVLADCLQHAPGSTFWPADLADPEGAAALAKEIWESYGHLDYVINNAGTPMRRPVPRLTMAEVRRVMAVNYFSPVAITLAVLPMMLERRSGTIVQVSSLGGRLGIPTEAAYSASKFALTGFSEAMAADLFDTGVRVRLVSPGAIETEIWDQPDNDDPVYIGPLMPARDFAAEMIAGIDGDRFELYIPDMKGVVDMKNADFEAFLEGMAAMTRHEVDDAAMAEVMRGEHDAGGVAEVLKGQPGGTAP
ncbi:MAG TPA: SDR family NAD(P)-dependent oxidoreductase [Acidimicrobiales bacterium]|nr:SDR family NAD(P)-dependent oxidoreductase [Acidimicrobiales bacterium]